MLTSMTLIPTTCRPSWKTEASPCTRKAPPLLDMDLMGKLHELVRGGQDQEAIAVLRPYLLDVLGKAL